jgi:antitoxin component YwqK of YwqJK toxin-antitoxin module
MTTYYKEGGIKSIGSFENNELNGEYREFHPDGSVMLEGTYKHGVKDGKWVTFDESGKKIETVKYVNGEVK